MSNRRDIYLRAHTAKHTEKSGGPPRRAKASVPKWPEHALIFDTETRTDVHQELMVGIYRICRLVGDGYVCDSEGVVYSEAITNDELNQIGTFVSNTLPDVEVKQFPPETRLRVHRSFPEFMQKVIWPAVRKGWMIVGFNLPFDLSRLSRGWRRSRRGGFRLPRCSLITRVARGDHIRTVPRSTVTRKTPELHSLLSASHAFVKTNGQIQDGS